VFLPPAKSLCSLLNLVHHVMHWFETHKKLTCAMNIDLGGIFM
jgi:hypothetical protein